MIYLIQLLKMLSKEDLNQFKAIFSDLSYEIDEMGYKEHEGELISDLLDNHFHIQLKDAKQLESLTKIILDKNKFNQH